MKRDAVIVSAVRTAIDRQGSALAIRIWELPQKI
jgi:hypothetical protein